MNLLKEKKKKNKAQSIFSVVLYAITNIFMVKSYSLLPHFDTHKFLFLNNSCYSKLLFLKQIFLLPHDTLW